MKKFLLLIFICSVTYFSKAQDGLTLNGYTQTEAEQYIKQFNPNDHTPTSVWFSRQEVQDMVNMLKHEQIIRTLKHLPKIDGIRVYWGSKDGNKNNVLLLYSTYNHGSDNKYPNNSLHKNYVTHDPNSKLYKDKFSNPGGIYGDLSHYNPKDGAQGALLYTDCGSNPCREDEKCRNYPNGKLHYITRIYGQKMVKAFEENTTTPIKTTSEWFDLHMFSEIHSGMKKEHYKKSDKYDGVRIYFARHLHSNDVISRDTEAFVIEATTAGPKDTHVDSFNCNTAKSYFEKLNKSQIIKPILKDNSNLDFNLNITMFSPDFIKLRPKINLYFSILKKFNKQSPKYLQAKNYLASQAVLANGLDNGELCQPHCQQ